MPETSSIRWKCGAFLRCVECFIVIKTCTCQRLLPMRFQMGEVAPHDLTVLSGTRQHDGPSILATMSRASAPGCLMSLIVSTSKNRVIGKFIMTDAGRPVKRFAVVPPGQ